MGNLLKRAAGHVRHLLLSCVYQPVVRPLTGAVNRTRSNVGYVVGLWLGRSPSLTTLANRCCCDKGTAHGERHGYTRVYDRLFYHLRDRPIVMVEIGIGVEGPGSFGTTVNHRNPGAASLRMWYEYFPQAKIIGIDLNDASRFDNDRISTSVADQADPDSILRVLGDRDRSPSLIIDDGSHASPHQQRTLARLFPILEPGGFYVIEDLHWQPKFLETHECELTKDVLRDFQQTGNFRSAAVAQDETQYLEEQVESVVLYSFGSVVKVAVLTKRVGKQGNRTFK